MTFAEWIRSRPLTFWVGVPAAAAMSVVIGGGTYFDAMAKALGEPPGSVTPDMPMATLAAFLLVFFAGLSTAWSFDRLWARLVALCVGMGWIVQVLMMFVLVTFTDGGSFSSAFTLPVLCGLGVLAAAGIDQALAMRARRGAA